MTNPFDQFDTQAGNGNPFDQFDAPRSTLQDIDRKAGIGTQGVTRSLYGAVAAPFDAAAALTNAIGLSSGPSRIGEAIRGAPTAMVQALGRDKLVPENRTEKAIEGAGEAVGSTLAVMAPAGALSRALPAGTVGQGVAQSVASQPGMQLASAAAGGATQGATDNPYLGLAAAMAVPTAAGLGARAVSPMGPARTAAETERRRLVDVLRQQNVPLSTGEITGNKGVQALESVMETLPLSGGLQRGFRERQQEAANRVVTGFTGDALPAFTNAERGGRKAELGKTFENLSKGTTVNLDQPFVTQLNDALTRYRQQLPADISRNIEQRLDDLISAATQPGSPQIPGDIYQRMRSRLSRQAANASDGDVRDALREARNALDAAARRSLPADVGAEWDNVRRQYGNLKTIENGMRNTEAAVGNISPKSLGQAVDTSNRRGGSRDMTDTAAALRKVLGDKLGQSGTQPRSFWEKVATLGGIGGSTYGLTQSPGMTLASVLAAPGLQVALENPLTRAYVGNRLAGNVPTLPGRELAGSIGIAQALANQDRVTVPNARNGRRQDRSGPRP